MIRRRQLVKSSLIGAAALSSCFARMAFGTNGSAGITVTTKFGKVRGVSAEGVHIFKGVHYGATTKLAFVFDNTHKTAGLNGTGPDLAPLAERVSSAWSAFARTGNPNTSGWLHWPAYDTRARATMIFNDQSGIVDDPGRDERLALTALPTTQG